MAVPTQSELFEKPEGVGEPARTREVADGVARVLRPNREQMELRACDLESLLAPDHRARLVWAWVGRSDLSGLYAEIRALEGGGGRPSIAPEILYALWLYATLEGEGSARTLARLTQEHDAYRWICGGVSVSYHTLSDFRSAHGEILDGLLTDSVAALLAEGVVTLGEVAQDGMRVRASAGAASFRRGESLERCLQEARARVERLKRAFDEDPGAASRRRQAAQERAARERQERLERAIERLPEMAEIKARQAKRRGKNDQDKQGEDKPEEARVSSTDAEATVMKMADGGWRPAYNGQFAADAASQVVVGVEVVCEGSDAAQMVPMIDQVEARCGQVPDKYLVDGGFGTHEQIEQAAERTTVYAPVPKSRSPEVDPHAPKRGDSEPIKAWRERMGSEEAKAIYRDRAATIECVNAQARQRGLQQLRVRGRAKVRSVLLLHALAHNLTRTLALAPQLLGRGTSLSAETAMAT
jgi:transposase